MTQVADSKPKVGATKNVAFRFRGDRIRCNAICPGGKIILVQKRSQGEKAEFHRCPNEHPPVHRPNEVRYGGHEIHATRPRSGCSRRYWICRAAEACKRACISHIGSEFGNQRVNNPCRPRLEHPMNTSSCMY